MSLLTVIQYACRRAALPVPSTVIGTTDQQVAQLYALLEEEGNDLAQRGEWEALTREASWTTTAAEDQGAMTTLASNGFRAIRNDTIWSRTRRLPVAGPLSPQDWQTLKAWSVSGPYYQYRIRGGRLLVNPAAPAGESWFFEYLSQNWILGADGTTYKQYFTLDTDTLLVPESLALAGLRWRWKKEKGLEYAEDFRTYEMQVKNALGSDGGKPTLAMDLGGDTPQAGIIVPIGSWF